VGTTSSIFRSLEAAFFLLSTFTGYVLPYSLKSMLPALVPEMTYEVGNWQDAGARVGIAGAGKIG
jgi:hypothetical protein